MILILVNKAREGMGAAVPVMYGHAFHEIYIFTEEILSEISFRFAFKNSASE